VSLRLVAAVLLATVGLAGCGGGGEETLRSDELPVACVAKPRPGPCSGGLQRYYYDYRDDRCKAFYWSGCGGHVPFETSAECTAQCVGRN